MKLPDKGEIVSLSKIKEICDFYELTDLWQKIKTDPPEKPFSSDGCSCWFDQWRGVSFYNVCFIHDLKYWAGYPNERIQRLQADVDLMMGVADLLGDTKMAVTMFMGIRFGGGERYGRSYSWGFGREADEGL